MCCYRIKKPKLNDVCVLFKNWHFCCRMQEMHSKNPDFKILPGGMPPDPSRSSWRCKFLPSLLTPKLLLPNKTLMKTLEGREERSLFSQAKGTPIPHLLNACTCYLEILLTIEPWHLRTKTKILKILNDQKYKIFQQLANIHLKLWLFKIGGGFLIFTFPISRPKSREINSIISHTL